MRCSATDAQEASDPRSADPSPPAAYGAWLALARRKARLAGTGALPRFKEAPWTWLLTAGLSPLALGFAFLARIGDHEPGARHVPARMIDGDIVPGRLE